MLEEEDKYEIPDEQELFSLRKVARAKGEQDAHISKVSEPGESKDESNSDVDEASDTDNENDDSGYGINMLIGPEVDDTQKIIITGF